MVQARLLPQIKTLNPSLPMSSKCFSLFATFALVLTSLTWQNLGAQEIVDPNIGDPYPLEVCILSGEPLDDSPEIFTHEGQEIRVCCSDCKSKFAGEAYLRVDEINAALKKEQKPFYPLDKCIVTGKELGADAVDFVFRNRLFRLSSSAAEAELKKAPAKYFADLDAAVVEKQKGSYPLKTCVVSDKPLGDDAIDHVVANQLVRLAGFDQLTAFNENPGKFLVKIREAK